MGYITLYADIKDLPKLRKAGIDFEVKKGMDRKNSKELLAMGFTYDQLKHFRRAYPEIIVSNGRGKERGEDKPGVMKNIVYDFSEMRHLGLTPSTRKNSKVIKLTEIYNYTNNS